MERIKRYTGDFQLLLCNINIDSVKIFASPKYDYNYQIKNIYNDWYNYDKESYKKFVDYVNNNINNKEEKAVFIYTTDKIYKEINRYLRNISQGNIQCINKFVFIIANILAYIDKYSKNFPKLYRGLNKYCNVGRYNGIGEVFCSNQITSTSTKPEIAYGFINGYIKNYTIIEFHGIIGAPVHYSAFPQEQEVIIKYSCNDKFKIRARIKDNSHEGSRLIAVPWNDGYKQYEVQENETLSEISKKLRVSIYDLKKLNYIENPNLIYAGEYLFYE